MTQEARTVWIHVYQDSYANIIMTLQIHVHALVCTSVVSVWLLPGYMCYQLCILFLPSQKLAKLSSVSKASSSDTNILL